MPTDDSGTVLKVVWADEAIRAARDLLIGYRDGAIKAIDPNGQPLACAIDMLRLVADDGRCQNCGKPMSAHNEMGWCYDAAPVSIPMRLPCPTCSALHIDEGEFATKSHHTHACQECGNVWRPAIEPTVGVRFLPGFKNEEARP